MNTLQLSPQDSAIVREALTRTARMQEIQAKRLLNKEDVALLMGVSVDTVNRYIRQNRVRAPNNFGLWETKQILEYLGNPRI